MKFSVLPSRSSSVGRRMNECVLLEDEWDDYFQYSTLYILLYYDAEGQRHRIGEVKIGQFQMEEGQRRASIPLEFLNLDERFFSLGQDDSYYEKLTEISAGIRGEVLSALRDLAAEDRSLFARALEEKVTGVSLMRNVSKTTVLHQFSRLASGGARVTPYEFAYQMPIPPRGKEAPVLKFEVRPTESPPSNIHILIGRNGVGKTYALNAMTRNLAEEKSEEDTGRFFFEADDWGEIDQSSAFSTLVSVTFSAFDPFDPLPLRQDQSEGLQYHYVGLKWRTKNKDGTQKSPKSPDELTKDFTGSLGNVFLQEGSRNRWARAIKLLESDPVFSRIGFWKLLEEFNEKLEGQLASDLTSTIQGLKDSARPLFRNLSSGHKIVVLTITRLVETVAERSLVLLDEPEAHLHPPLLSALARSISDLLINRNAVAIIATHSPVILQEVPVSCVWKIWRAGHELKAERPEIETFGENVGSLTHDVFGLEVQDSGFYKLLKDAVQEYGSREKVIEEFGDQLGSEARALLFSLAASRAS